CNYDLKSHLPNIKTPGLLVAGEGDGKLPEVMQNFGIPTTSFKSIPNAGHLPMLENHDAFMDALAGFLREQRANRTAQSTFSPKSDLTGR
ncbi:hypothetical protein KC353_g16616, partial [Hortaea werneckii]